MGLFHRHTWSTFTCSAREVDGIKFISAKDIASNKDYCLGHPSEHRCPNHPHRSLRSDGECFECSYKVAFLDVPRLDDVLITYKVCLTCGAYDVTTQCGKYKYNVNKEYVKLKIEAVKKEKEEAETERLLNLGNPDYKPTVKNAKVISEYEKTIEDQKKSISLLQTYLRTVLSRLNVSLKNDGIWEALPPKVRKDLIVKYGEKAATYEPVSMDDIAKCVTQNNPKA
jgi:hypothetical protein